VLSARRSNDCPKEVRLRNREEQEQRTDDSPESHVDPQQSEVMTHLSLSVVM
jgi:hypothetical protein